LLLAGVPAAVLMVALLPKVLVAAQPRLQQIAPQGGQRGTEVTVVFSGQRIGQKPQEILWHDPGIETLELKRLEGNRVEARLAIPEASRPGIHGLRIRTQS